MRLRTVALLVLMLALFSGSAVAQTSPTGGVKGGIGFASVSMEGDLDILLPDSRTGVLVGGFVDLPVRDMFSVVIEGLYSQKGATGTFTEEGITADVTVKADYIEIPILAQFPFSTTNVRPFVYGGVAPAFRTSAKVEARFMGETEEDDIADEVKSMDLGLVFGGGIRFGHFAIEARYNLGLLDINEESDQEGSIKSRQIAILASFSFP
jgi:hypothetical protein